MNLTREQWLGIARHVVGAIGAMLVTRGMLEAAEAEIIVGAALGILAVLGSIKAPEKR